jgi:hypothetical protein
MADNKSNYLENAFLNHVLRGNVAGTALPQPSTIYLALYTTSPTDTGGGVEVSGNGYVRQVVTFGVPSSGQTTNSNAVLFPVSTAAWGNIVGFGLHDALGGGNLLYYGALSTSVLVDAANRRIEFETGTLVVQEN